MAEALSLRSRLTKPIPFTALGTTRQSHSCFCGPLGPRPGPPAGPLGAALRPPPPTQPPKGRAQHALSNFPRPVSPPPACCHALPVLSPKCVFAPLARSSAAATLTRGFSAWKRLTPGPESAASKRFSRCEQRPGLCPLDGASALLPRAPADPVGRPLPGPGKDKSDPLRPSLWPASP